MIRRKAAGIIIRDAYFTDNPKNVLTFSLLQSNFENAGKSDVAIGTMTAERKIMKFNDALKFPMS